MSDVPVFVHKSKMNLEGFQEKGLPTLKEPELSDEEELQLKGEKKAAKRPVKQLEITKSKQEESESEEETESENEEESEESEEDFSFFKSQISSFGETGINFDEPQGFFK